MLSGERSQAAELDSSRSLPSPNSTHGTWEDTVELLSLICHPIINTVEPCICERWLSHRCVKRLYVCQSYSCGLYFIVDYLLAATIAYPGHYRNQHEWDWKDATDRQFYGKDGQLDTNNLGKSSFSEVWKFWRWGACFLHYDWIRTCGILTHWQELGKKPVWETPLTYFQLPHVCIWCGRGFRVLYTDTQVATMSHGSRLVARIAR